jgi:hypothetical protein
VKHLFLAFLVLGTLAISPEARADLSASVAEACKTFGGAFEATTTGYGSDAVTKFTCRFPDGSGRSCDSSGACSALGATSTSQASAAPDAPQPASSETDACYSCRKACADQCSSKGVLRAQMSCRRGCIEERCQAQCSEAQ